MALMQIQPRKGALALKLAVVGGAAWLCASAIGNLFVGTSAPPGRNKARALVEVQSYESGKVNLGVEVSDDVPPPPMPVLECDQSCMTAIFDCLEEGCSVEALEQLDKELAEDEAKVQKSVEELADMQKTSFSPENKGTIAWLENFLSRTGSLRAQLRHLTSHQDTDFIKQMVKAASVAFGGGRHGDYPKVGVSPYSA